MFLGILLGHLAVTAAAPLSDPAATIRGASSVRLAARWDALLSLA